MRWRWKSILISSRPASTFHFRKLYHQNPTTPLSHCSNLRRDIWRYFLSRCGPITHCEYSLLSTPPSMEETDPDYQRIANHLLDSLQEYPDEVEQEPLLRNQTVIRFLWDQISEKTEILGPHLSPEQKLYTTWHSVWFYYCK